MSEGIVLAESARDSYGALSPDARGSVREALSRLVENPIAGVPLMPPLDGRWSLRDDDLRLVYRPVPQGPVVILSISVATKEESR
jgi:mRNA-degrading endonuclease RelE of RelBE toxin-antitoxin system